MTMANIHRILLPHTRYGIFLGEKNLCAYVGYKLNFLNETPFLLGRTTYKVRLFCLGHMADIFTKIKWAFYFRETTDICE